MSVRGAGQRINATVCAWDGVTAHPQRFGGTEYRLGDREIGHVHGDGLVDIPFPTKVRDEIVAAGEAVAHHVLPQSGWVSFYLRQPEDIERAIALLRRSYDIAVGQKARARPREPQRSGSTPPPGGGFRRLNSKHSPACGALKTSFLRMA